MFNFAKGFKRVANLSQRAQFFFSENAKPKFIPKNNSGKIIGGTVVLTSALLFGLFKKFGGKDEFYNEEELQRKGIFVEDQKLISKNNRTLKPQFSLQVKPWVLTSQEGQQVNSLNLNERYYFVLLGHNQAMIDKLYKVFDEIKHQVQTKYYLSPEYESYKVDIEKPIIISVDSQKIPLNVKENTLLLNGPQQAINGGFNSLYISNYSNRLFLVDGLNGQTVSIQLNNSDQENDKLVAIFLLNYLNEASVFRGFLQ